MKRILVVDDESINLAVLSKVLNPHFQVLAVKSGETALRIAGLDPIPDLILLDIMMPGLDGYAVLEQLRLNSRCKEIPVIYISALDSQVDEERGFQLGALDYITKPFRPAIVLERVKVHLELKDARDRLSNQNEWLESELNRRMLENQLIQDVTLNIITQLAETRDDATAHHILRTRSYIELLARNLMHKVKYRDLLPDNTVTTIVKASPLHDIGKIGINDAILLKKGRLTEDEYEIMKTHSNIGGDAIHNAIDRALHINVEKLYGSKHKSLQFLETAEAIARFHHERWDGRGYPNGLKGDEIPLPAQMMALADVFDALTSARPYKSPWTFAQTAGFIREQRGTQFAPDIVDAFEEELSSFETVLLQFADSKPEDGALT